MKCKYCRCTDGHACTGGCSWIKENVCSNCFLRDIAAAINYLAGARSDPDVKTMGIWFIDKDGKENKMEIGKE